MTSLFDLTGQAALVTGASRGVGRAAAAGLAEAGAVVCLVYRRGSSERYELSLLPRADYDLFALHSATLKEIEERGLRAVVAECDLGDLEDVQSLFPRALSALAAAGHPEAIHILVNCAGIQRRAPAAEFPLGEWDDVLKTNLTSCFLLAQAAARHMLPLRRGKIINLCSLMTFQGGLTVPAYAAAKGGLGQLTKALANEWSAQGVQVNGICPGYVRTDMNAALLADPERLAQISARIPAGRWGAPEDFKGPVVFLASRASDYVCGELLVVDGGWMGR